MANNMVPTQALGNVSVFKEAVHGTTLTAPNKQGARWVAIHNIHGTDLSIFVPGNEIHESFAEDGIARSLVYDPGNAGRMDTGDAIDSIATVTAGDATTGARASSTVTVTRDGVDITADVTAPNFTGITVAGGVVTAGAVHTTEGSGLKVGDVLTFALVTDTDVELSLTLVEDSLALSAGVYIRKAADAVDIHTLGAGEIFYGNFSKFYIVADDTDGDGIVAAYFN
jgi:hypothetical protein